MKCPECGEKMIEIRPSLYFEQWHCEDCDIVCDGETIDEDY